MDSRWRTLFIYKIKINIMTDQEKRYLRHLDYKLKCLISKVNALDPSGEGGPISIGDEILNYNSDEGAFLIINEDGELANFGTISENGILLHIDENDFNVSWALNKTYGVGIPRGSVISVNLDRTEAISIVGDLSELTGNTHHTSGSFNSTYYYDIDNETELATSSFVNLPDFTMLQLGSNDDEITSGFTNGNLIPGPYTETNHFPRFYSNDIANNIECVFGLIGNVVVLLNNGIPIFNLPNIPPNYKGKTFTSGTIPHELEWKFIDENRVKTDSSGTLSIIPDYNEGNVHEYTAIAGGTLSIGLPINMPNGADMKLRFLPTAITSFAPEMSYFFNTTTPADLEANKFVEMQIRKFNNNFYANLIIWE